MSEIDIDEVIALAIRQATVERGRKVWGAMLELHPILKLAAARSENIVVARALQPEPSVFENIVAGIILHDIDRQVPRGALAAHMETHRN